MSPSVAQPTAEQVLAALELNGVSVTRVDGFELQSDGSLVVQLDRDGGVLLPRPDWSPSRTCTGGAECVGQTICPRRHQCHE